MGLLVLSLTAHFGWFDHLEQRLYDIGLNLKNAPVSGSQCVIIAIDNATLDKWSGPRFPISLHLGELTRLVKALDSAGARVICIDLLFDRLEAAKREDISCFADACKKAGNVLLASAVEDTSDILGDRYNSSQLNLPWPTLNEAVAGVGLADVPIDFDGMIRRVEKTARFQGALLPSLSAQAVALYNQDNLEIASQDNTYLIDYSWLSRIKTISAQDVIDVSGVAEFARGKIAVIGVTDDGANDSYHVPINSASGKPLILPGVVVHAAAVQSLLSDRKIKLSSALVNLPLFVLVAVPFVFLSQARRTWITVACYMAAAPLLIVVSVLAVPLMYLMLPVIKSLFSLAVVIGVQMVLGITLLRRETISQLAVITEFSEDMQSAKVIQQHLQPRNVPVHPGLEIAALQLTCKEVGGDYYDFVELERGKIGFLIGDVAGKGVSASLIMSNVQAIFRKEASQQESPAATLKTINAHLSTLSSASGRFISIFYGILDPETLRLTYSNGGHCRPIVRNAAGNGYELAEGGLFVGPFPDMEWNDTSVQLSRGDLLCFYTDGVSEAYDVGEREQFGEERILEFLKQTTGTSEKVLQSLLEACQSYVGTRPFADDWTVIILKLK